VEVAAALAAPVEVAAVVVSRASIVLMQSTIRPAKWGSENGDKDVQEDYYDRQ
jgi:hypothetical protein